MLKKNTDTINNLVFIVCFLQLEGNDLKLGVYVDIIFKRRLSFGIASGIRLL
jgi:hypothetical protein